MATSYTSLLGLALPVTGELSGTWGDTVNNSITSLLDTAVAGTTTLSTDADVTLTTTTGASNQARQAILLCSGARTAIRTITAPAQSKFYSVINSTTGGYSVKVVGVGPTTGVTIVTGESALIAWNGSDYVKVASSLVSGLTGTLGVANGGTGLTSGTSGGVLYYSASGTLASSAALAANAIVLGGGAGSAPATTTTGTGVVTALGQNVTGSGGIVLATSPSLTTPSLGVATATSINKVALTQPATGSTLTIADGKTLTANNSLTLAGVDSKTLTVNNSLTLAGTDGTTMTFPSTSQTVAGLAAAQTFTATNTFSQIIYTVNTVTVSSNAGTVPITYRLNNFTNSSAATMTITLATASAVDGQMSIVRIYDASAVAQTISWVNTENSTVTAPTTSNGSTTLPLTVGFMYNGQTSKWRCIASA